LVPLRASEIGEQVLAKSILFFGREDGESSRFGFWEREEREAKETMYEY
jgi:hypothetical protein